MYMIYNPQSEIDPTPMDSWFQDEYNTREYAEDNPHLIYFIQEEEVLDSDPLHLTTVYESNTNWQDLARQIVFDWVYEGLGEGKNHPTFSKDEVYVVWYCFILGGWKALISTTLPDGRYYEVTYNKNKSEVYLDTYRKTHNQAIKIDDGQEKN